MARAKRGDVACSDLSRRARTAEMDRIAYGADERSGFGVLRAQQRRTRRLSQLDLALEAEISSRHLSFLETGRSRPSAAARRSTIARLGRERPVSRKLRWRRR